MARQATADTDKIDWGDVTALDPPNETVATWAMWVMIDSWASSDAYCTTWYKGGSYRPADRDANGAGTANFFSCLLTGDTTLAIDADDYTWTESVWHFYAAVFDGPADTLDLYASLEGAGSLTLAGSADVTALGGFVGNTASSMFNFQDGLGAFNFRGRLAHLAIFRAALSEVDLLDYRDNPSGHTTNRAFYAPLAGDDPEVDEDGAFTGTVTGTNVVDGPDLFQGPVYKRFHGPAQLTGSAATLYTCPSGKRARVLGIHASNPSGAEVDLNLSIGTDAAATRVYDDFPVTADSVESNYDPYDLAEGDVIQGWAGTAGTLVLTITGYEVPE